MIKLLKTFGKGLLYVIGLPFFLVVLALFGLVGIFLFIFQLVKSIIFFFTGRKFFPELPEDKELRLRKETAEAANESQNQIIDQPIENNDIVLPLIEEQPSFEEQPEPISDTVEAACFQESQNAFIEQPNEEENTFEDVLNDEINEEESINSFKELHEEQIETAVEEHSIAEEELEEYIPEGTVYDADIEDEEEDADIGVDIDYNL